MNDELLSSLLGSAMNTANNVVNKVAEDRKRTMEKEEAIAREQEETKRTIAQEEERTRREFVEKGLDQKHRDEIKELQEKRKANPINTVCESCTGTMDIDRFKGMMTCPYCGHTEVLDPIHCYDPVLDEPELTDVIHKRPSEAAQSETASSEPQSVSEAPRSAAPNGITIEKPAIRPNKSFSTPNTPSTSATRPASASDIANVNAEPLLNKVASAAKLIDSKPIEGFVEKQTRGMVISIISIICGVIGIISCGALIVPEVLGTILSLIPIAGNKNKYGKISKVLGSIGLTLSLSAGMLLLIVTFILKK